MNSVSEYLTFGFKFAKKYLQQYLMLLLVPFVLGVLGVLFVGLMMKDAKFIILGFLSIPLICAAFWRAYLVAYSLNYAAFEFAHSREADLARCLEKTKQTAKELAAFLGFCAVVSILGFLPCAIYAYFALRGLDYSLLASNLDILIKVLAVIIINSIFMLPFMNFLNQAFFFKRKDEGFLSLVLNCYKKLNSKGVALSIIFSFLGGVIGCFHPLIYCLLAVLLTLVTFSANTFWYYDRMK